MKLRYCFFILMLVGLLSEGLGQVVLYNNGSFITHPGSGPGGADYSFLIPPLGNYGFGNQLTVGQRVSDDFLVTGQGWVIDSIAFFQYQTGSSTYSTFTGTVLQIWKGSDIVWGDLTTNRLHRTIFSGCYRGDDFSNSQRPIMRNTVTTPGLELEPGTYNLDWQASGTLGSGPWCVPVASLTQLTTGDALGYYNGAWDYLYGDTLGIYKQGLPFIIYGHSAGIPSKVTINESYYFWDAYSVESYKIIGLPGMTNFSISSVMPGVGGDNWMAFWDNGQTNDFMKSYDGSGMFTFRPGNAFWITSESTVEIEREVDAVLTNQWNTCQIPLNTGGWTLISNPFGEDVDWADVLTANGLNATYFLWQWDGFWYPASKMEAGEGFYFFAPAWLSSLHIPSPYFKSGRKSPISSNISDKNLKINFMTQNTDFGSVIIRFDNTASDQADSTDILLPAAPWAPRGIQILRENSGDRQGLLFCDSRKSTTPGQSYMLRISNPTNQTGFLDMIDKLNEPNLSIWIVNNSTCRAIDMKEDTLLLQPMHTETFTLLIGSENYVRNTADKIYATGNRELRCFPNPAGSECSISWFCEHKSQVRILLYDLTGRVIRQIQDDIYEPGYYSAVVKREELNAGIYFCNLSMAPLSRKKPDSKTIRVLFR
jgi:hypothetical protein